MNGIAKFNVDFIGIGARKAATTWIAKNLAAHPDICIPPEKELHFFNQPITKEREEKYRCAFRLCSTKQKRGEFSTSYLSSSRAATQIYEFAPKAKLIVSLRDPVDRFFSHLRHLQSRGRLPAGITAAEAARRRPDLVTSGKYGEHIERFLQYFPREQIFIVLYEDIEHFSERVLRDLYSFLSVNEHFKSPFIERAFNTSHDRRSFFAKMRNKIYLKSRKAPTLHHTLRRFSKSSFQGRFRRTLPDEISREERRYVRTFYYEDIAKLEHLLGTEFTWR